MADFTGRAPAAWPAVAETPSFLRQRS
jgi:hypothetical protein